MQGEYLSYGLLGALAIALVLAAVTDLRRREIDNWLNLAIALGAPLFWLASGLGWVDIVIRLAIALAVFIVLVALFATGAMGGGDVKLLTALALWFEPLWLFQLIIVMAVAGGLLTAALYVPHRIGKSRARLAVPYGVAISLAGLWTLASQHVWRAPVAAFLG